jgi:MoxR-like ATPase
MFYPIFITGLSGNGKTYMVDQACAATKREVIRVNFTVETDEDDLIGGFRLVNGETKFFKGPVIKAMERGAVLLCDEIDLANPAKVMCLQSILEGKGYFIKKTGEFITPAHGFTVIATANTKGKGSDDGRFIGTNILNEAFLERYPITCEQEYPSPNIERKILDKVFDSVGASDPEFAQKLVDWADIIRKTFMDGGVDEIISTRRLVHIVKAFAIFGDRMTAIEMCTNRFDDETKLSFRDLYAKLDENVNINSDESVDNSF